MGDSGAAGVHLRGGNLVGEDHVDGRGEPAHMLSGSLHCVHAWGLPTYLSSSDRRIRAAVIDGAFGANVTGPLERDALHVTYDTVSPASAHFRTLVELGALAGASCFVASRSGFSDVARWWGGMDCVRYVGRPPVSRSNDGEAAEPSRECFEDYLAMEPTAEARAHALHESIYEM